MIYNYSSSLSGPFYAKVETNLSKRVGLVMSIAYEQTSFTGSYDIYRAKYDGSFSYSLVGPQDIDSGYPITQKKIQEESSFKSFSSNIRLNFYLLNKHDFNFIQALVLGIEPDRFPRIRQCGPNILKLKNAFIGSHFVELSLLPVGSEITLGFRQYFFKT